MKVCGTGYQPVSAACKEHGLVAHATVMIFQPILDQYGAPIVIGLFLLLLAGEIWRPLRRRVQSHLKRLLTNVAVAASAAVVIRLALIPVVVLVAHWSREHQFGLVYLLPIPTEPRAVIAFLLLDYTMYFWHWLNHRVPMLWRFHNVHHTDLDLDVSTAFRFHFGELALSVGVRSIQVALIGAGPILALVYEIALEASTEFHHSNLRLPAKLERLLNYLIVTPRMHGIHHSIVRRETDSNFSNMFCFWDRIHRTIRLNIHQDDVVIGVPDYRDSRELTFFSLLTMPFRRQRTAWRLPDGTQPERVDKGPKDERHFLKS